MSQPFIIVTYYAVHTWVKANDSTGVLQPDPFWGYLSDGYCWFFFCMGIDSLHMLRLKVMNILRIEFTRTFRFSLYCIRRNI